MTHYRKFLFLFAFLALVGLAFAGVNREAFQTTRGSGPELLFDGVTSVTSAAWSTPANPRYTRGNPKIGVSVSSTQAGATVEVSVGLYHYDPSDGTYTFLGLSDVQSVTLSSDQEVSAGVYTHEDALEFGTAAATVVDVRLTSISQDADLLLWGFGTEPTLTTAPSGS